MTPRHPAFVRRLAPAFARRLAPVLLCVAGLWHEPAARASETADTAGVRNFDLDEVVVTGVRTPKLLKDVPVQTRLITRRDIERSDATDIRDLLQAEMPGVEFSYAMNQQTHLNFNGQGGQSVLFLVDGERLAGETMDDVDFSRLDMANVDHIEIVKGASSALYGSNAGGGVINIITRKAAKPWRVNGDARWSKHNEQRYNLSVTAKGSKVSNVLTGSFYDIDNYNVKSAPDPVTRVIGTVYGSRVWNVQERIAYQPIDNLKLSGRAGYYFRQLTREADAPERYRDFTAGLRGEWGITENDRLEVAYSFDQYDKSDYYRRSNRDVRSYSNVQNTVRALYNHTFGNEDILTAGADFLYNYMLNTKLDDRRRHETWADAFLQYDWIIDPRWEVVGAVRYDYVSDGDMSRVTPKVSARYKPHQDVNIRLGYGMGFRAPTLKEKYYSFDMAGIWIVNGNPNLKPETSHNVTLSADYTHGNYNVTVSGYYNNIRNKITTGVPYYRPDDPTELYLDYVNLNRFTVWGGEITLQGKWKNGLGARVSYAYTDEHQARDKGGNNVANQYIPARKHSLTCRLDWGKEFSKVYTLNVSVNGRVLSSVKNVEYRDYYDISKGTVTVNYPAYTLWKLSVSQRFTRYVTLNLAVDNIFNYKPKYYYLNCPLTDGAALQVGLAFDIY